MSYLGTKFNTRTKNFIPGQKKFIPGHKISYLGTKFHTWAQNFIPRNNSSNKGDFLLLKAPSFRINIVQLRIFDQSERL
jgi:hypothetical protein